MCTSGVFSAHFVSPLPIREKNKDGNEAGGIRRPEHTVGNEERRASTFLSVIDVSPDSFVQMTWDQSMRFQTANSITQYKRINQKN